MWIWEIRKCCTCYDNHISKSENRTLAEIYEIDRQIQQYIELYLKVRV